jgi:hypothetical protein
MISHRAKRSECIMSQSRLIVRQFPDLKRFLIAAAVLLCTAAVRSDDSNPSAADSPAFATFDRDADGRITLQELVEREQFPSTGDPLVSMGDHMVAIWPILWEERAMRLEDALMYADDNHDRALSPLEFNRYRAEFVAAVLGKPPPQKAREKNSAAPPGATGTVPRSSWPVAGLIGGNVILLAGAAWRLHRRAVRNAQPARRTGSFSPLMPAGGIGIRKDER